MLAVHDHVLDRVVGGVLLLLKIALIVEQTLKNRFGAAAAAAAFAVRSARRRCRGRVHSRGRRHRCGIPRQPKRSPRPGGKLILVRRRRSRSCTVAGSSRRKADRAAPRTPIRPGTGRGAPLRTSPSPGSEPTRPGGVGVSGMTADKLADALVLEPSLSRSGRVAPATAAAEQCDTAHCDTGGRCRTTGPPDAGGREDHRPICPYGAESPIT